MELKNEENVTLIKDLYELKSFIEAIPEKRFRSYINKSAEEFYLKVASIIKDQKLIDDIIESPSKEAMMLCLNSYIHGKPQQDIQKQKISDTISQKICFGTAREFKKTAMIIPLKRNDMLFQLKEIYK